MDAASGGEGAMVGQRRRRTREAWQLDGDDAGGIGMGGRRGWNQGCWKLSVMLNCR
jgi:hypothetical protein